MGAISADQGTVPTASTKAALLLQRAAGYRHTVNQRLTSPVREICTLGSVGAGGRRLPPATRWAISDGRPYCDTYGESWRSARVIFRLAANRPETRINECFCDLFLVFEASFINGIVESPELRQRCASVDQQWG